MASSLPVFFCLLTVYYAEISSAGVEDTKLTPPPPEDYKILNKQKVAVLSGNVIGYQQEGDPTLLTGRGFRFTIQKYVKTDKGECVKLVTIRRLNTDEVLDEAKISCEYTEPDRKRGLNLHIDTVIFETPPNNVIFVVKDGVCFKKSYSRPGEVPKIVSGSLDNKECDELTRKSKKQRTRGVIPGTELISSRDINVMNKQIVAVLEGNPKDFTPQEAEPTFFTASKLYQVEVQEFKKNKQCVKVVSFKRIDHDEYFEKVKVSCRITGPKITDDEDIDLNFGNVIYILDRKTAVFVMKGGICLERTYRVKWSEVERMDRILSTPDCYHLTRWRLKSRRSSVKLNQEPPSKTVQTPGFMWLLATSGETLNYRMGPGHTYMGGSDMFMHSQDYHKGEECFRLLDIRVYGVEVDKYKVACGPARTMVVSDMSIQYGKAFIFRPIAETNDFTVLFNFRDKPCVKRTYTILKGNPSTVTKSNDENTEEGDCAALKEGKSLLKIEIPPATASIVSDKMEDGGETIVSDSENSESNKNIDREDSVSSKNKERKYSVSSKTGKSKDSSKTNESKDGVSSKNSEREDSVGSKTDKSKDSSKTNESKDGVSSKNSEREDSVSSKTDKSKDSSKTNESKDGVSSKTNKSTEKPGFIQEMLSNLW